MVAANARISIRPDVFFDNRKWLFCRVKILIVTDSTAGGFGPTDGFHLGQILNILANDPWSHVIFEVTKANRNSDGTADMQDFRFHTHDLSQYSQIWLFGINRTEDALSQAELKALTQFMDQGGGLFATGDHENLGQAMCAEVPRIRSMRRWYHPNPGPNGEPVAPDQVGPGRHDTLVTPGPGLPQDQSDDVPQPIRPRFYSRITGSGIVQTVHRFPHPVLCGPNGSIAYLPDHMHEGLCEVPADLTRSYTFDGYTSAEYPEVSGNRVSPEVIAWARTRNTDNREFGVLAAYDGHAAGVGRVVVDATWHHWFNINLMGFINATNPAHPSYDPAVVPQWEAIKAYYRNVGAWLARPGLQDCLRNGGWLIAISYYDIRITYRALQLVPNKLAYFWQLGTFARDALGRIASQCQTTNWVIDFLDFIDIQIRPWPPFRNPPLPDPPPWLNITELETVALGGAMHALLDAFGKDQEPQTLLARRSKEVNAAARKGAAAATAEWAGHYAKAAEDVIRIGKLAQKHC